MLPHYAQSLLEAVLDECDITKKAESRYVDVTSKPPKEFRIFQSENPDWAHGYCREPYIRAWHYRQSQLSEVDPGTLSLSNGQAQGMYYQIAQIFFSVDENAKRALYTYTLGPKYARGFRVSFDNIDSFQMMPKNDRLLWLS